MKYRDRIDIISQILKIANGGGVTRTKIMYRGLLSYAQIKEYLILLIEKELLRYDKENQTFKTTEKGLRFLDTYSRLGDMIKEQHNDKCDTKGRSLIASCIYLANTFWLLLADLRRANITNKRIPLTKWLYSTAYTFLLSLFCFLIFEEK